MTAGYLHVAHDGLYSLAVANLDGNSVFLIAENGNPDNKVMKELILFEFRFILWLWFSCCCNYNQCDSIATTTNIIITSSFPQTYVGHRHHITLEADTPAYFELRYRTQGRGHGLDDPVLFLRLILVRK